MSSKKEKLIAISEDAQSELPFPQRATADNLQGPSFDTSWGSGTRLSRLIPSLGGTPQAPAPPEPSVDLAISADEPSKFFKLYKSRYQARIFIGVVFLLLSLSFEVVFPYLVGYLIQNQSDLHSDVIT